MNNEVNLIPYFWLFFKKYLNNPSYMVKQGDTLASIFMKGEIDVKDFINTCNIKAKEMGLKTQLKYRKNLTYSQLLKQLKS